LKCRQRKKAWLANLQAKVEYLTADNETLQTTVQALRDEIASLRTLLISHKDCSAHAVNAGPGISTVGDFLAASHQAIPERPEPPYQNQFA
jgi:ATF/CREB family transcription factor